MKADFRMFFSAFSDSDRSRKPCPWSILLLSTPSACSVLEPGPTPSPWSILFLFMPSAFHPLLGNSRDRKFVSPNILA